MLTAIILAAGQGKRMKSQLPKILHKIGGKPMLFHVLDLVAALKVEQTIVVLRRDMAPTIAALGKHYPSVDIAYQEQPLGTGDAVKSAVPQIKNKAGSTLVLCGDTPLLQAESIRAITKTSEAAMLLGFRPRDAAEYGRLVTGSDGYLERIVEFKDASPAERQIGLCNSGVLTVQTPLLAALLPQIENNNAAGEYYLTDIFQLLTENGHRAAIAEVAEEEVMGINSRVQLAAAEAVFQQRQRRVVMENGATLIAPETVFFSHDTVLGQDVIVHPHVVFGEGVRVADGVEIRSFCHIEGARIESGAIIGPFARLRPGSEIGEQAHIGNFVEIKNSQVAAGAKANHLSYIGDASVGANANIGAGTITANYDGFTKSRTVVGEGASVGSNSVLVAPVTVGEGSIIGAGSVITEDVAPHALALSRPELKQLPGKAKQIRERKREKRK